MKLRWFCKHCQTNGEIILEAGSHGMRHVEARLLEDHAKQDQIKQTPWVLINARSIGVVAVSPDATQALLEMPAPISELEPFIILHVQ